MRNGYISALYDLISENDEIISLVADNGAIVFDKLRADFPEKFINYGISEANMVSSAAGLASCGFIPFAYTIAGFITMRAFEQVRNDVCLQQQNVKLVGVGGGTAYSVLGPTHHACEDIGVMRVLPGMTIIVPASPKEAYKATIEVAKMTGPVYLRLEATKEPEIYKDDYKFQIGKGILLKEGSDITLISCGSITSDVLMAVEEIEKENKIKVRVINMHTIKPIDEEIIISAAKETKAIVSVEEHNVIGGLGSAVGEVLLKNGCNGVIFDKMGFEDCFCKGYAKRQELKAMNGLGIINIKEKIIEILKKKGN